MFPNLLRKIFGSGGEPAYFPALVALRAGLVPDDLSFERDLDLRDSSIKALPLGLKVGGTLDIRNCSRLAALPDDLIVGGKLLADECTALCEIPSGISVNWGIELSGCSSLTKIADGFVAQWDLILNGCDNLERLPDDLTVGGNLVLRGCKSLKDLPRRLKVGRNLIIEKCDFLIKGPDSLSVDGNVTIRDCPNINSIGASVIIRGYLEIYDCPLIELSNGMSVLGFLGMENSPIAELPQQLAVGDELDLRGCRNLKSLGHELSVGGTLDISNCEKLTKLDGLISAREIDIAGTSITEFPAELNGVNWLWRGIRVPSHVIFNPETIKVEEILNQPNAEVRRVMLERFGFERFISQANATVVHADRDPGGDRKLLRVPFKDDEPLVCLQVHCPSTAALYILRVPPNMQTCHQAAAWVAGFDNADDYKPLIET